MPITYDPALLTSSAEKLYRKATLIAVGYAARGALLGGVLGALFAGMRNGDVMTTATISAGVLALIGVSMGAEKAFALRLEAQRTLCLLQTEINTRKP